MRLIILYLCTFAHTFAAGSLGAAVPAEQIDYEEPKLLTGSIYRKDPASDRLLFKFRRTATRSGNTVEVLREYYSPEGSLAARERAVYDRDHLVSYKMDELQSGASGSAVFRSEASSSKSQRIVFEYISKPGAKTQQGNEAVRQDVLINDMIPAILVAHWKELMNGVAVRFRFIVLQRAETVGFKLVKESESTRRGTPVVIVRMEPTSPIIARLVNPIRFTVEQEGEHRILEYVGRTTPMIKNRNRWEDLDALTVFDWTR